MAIAVTNESENSASVTNESIADSTTWEQHPESWGENQGTFAAPGIGVAKESANSITVTNESI